MAITFAQLRSFATVVRTGSVTAAAQELWVTQPSVSAALASLADEVGVELFRRTGRTLTLTPAGEAMAHGAQRILGTLDQALLAAREAGGAVDRQVRIAAVTTAGEYLVPSLIRGFAPAHPEIGVELHVGNRERVFRLLRTRRADLAVAGRPPSGEDLVAEPVLANEIVLVTAPGDPLASAGPVEVGALSARTWLVRETGSGTRAMSQSYLDANGLEPKILTLGSNGAIKQAARLGLGLALLPTIAVQAELQQGLLAPVVTTSPPAEERHWYLIRPDDEPRESVAAFIDHARDAAALDPVLSVAPDR